MQLAQNTKGHNAASKEMGALIAGSFIFGSKHLPQTSTGKRNAGRGCVNFLSSAFLLLVLVLGKVLGVGAPAINAVVFLASCID